MKLVNQETTLVIAGAWNPAILTPSWVLKNGLRKELNGNNKVEIAMPVDIGIFQFPTYTLEDLQYTARADALVFSSKRRRKIDCNYWKRLLHEH